MSNFETMLISYLALIPISMLIIFGVVSEEPMAFKKRLMYTAAAFVWPLLFICSTLLVVFDFFRWFFTGKTL